MKWLMTHDSCHDLQLCDSWRWPAAYLKIIFANKFYRLSLSLRSGCFPARLLQNQHSLTEVLLICDLDTITTSSASPVSLWLYDSMILWYSMTYLLLWPSRLNHQGQNAKSNLSSQSVCKSVSCFLVHQSKSAKKVLPPSYRSSPRTRVRPPTESELDSVSAPSPSLPGCWSGSASTLSEGWASSLLDQLDEGVVQPELDPKSRGVGGGKLPDWTAIRLWEDPGQQGKHSCCQNGGRHSVASNVWTAAIQSWTNSTSASK